jgi:hypothetical protein
MITEQCRYDDRELKSLAHVARVVEIIADYCKWLQMVADRTSRDGLALRMRLRSRARRR